MKNAAVGVFFVALTTLLLELTLIKLFDALWYPNMAYMVITLALFNFAAAGVYVSLKPAWLTGVQVRSRLAWITVVFGVATVAILPSMNTLPLNFDDLYTRPLYSFVWFVLMYLVLSIPFFFSGLVFTTVFSVYASEIRSLYFWDLLGAGLGCILLLPLFPRLGPGGVLVLACGLAFWATAAFTRTTRWRGVASLTGVVLVLVPFFTPPQWLEFNEHMTKRSVSIYRARGQIELSYWDPTSKIDVIKKEHRRELAYDGGSQSSYIVPFDGDLVKLRDSFPEKLKWHFNSRGVVVSHMLREGSNPSVLVIGSAGGQEVKAALAYGAKQIDAVEMVGYVVKLGKEVYADYNGGIYKHPKVNYQVAEGRSFLRGTEKKYDIIQMYSNYTTSSIAAGTGAMATTYLQTAEAYEEYFSHLTDSGILHINHRVYPRMITTAALAWKRLGKTNFRRHVLVYGSVVGHHAPLLMIKMAPWTPDEIKRVSRFLGRSIKLKENPLEPGIGMLSEEFFSGQFSDELQAHIPYRVAGATDNRPYFNFLRKTNAKLKFDPDHYVTASTAALLNSQLKRGFLPTDIIHLFVTGFISMLFVVLFFVVPLLFSNVGRVRWAGKAPSLVYFSCLGAGFIVIELVFIQLFMKLIGYPLYTYGAVVFALLASAGVGSLSAAILDINPDRRWWWPFVGIVVATLLLLVTHGEIFQYFLTATTPIRILVSIVLIFPVGFFLGMPLPLGILAIKEQPRGAIAWAWGMNGLFTVVGGLVSVLLSIYIGFREALMFAVVIYIFASLVFNRLRRTT